MLLEAVAAEICLRALIRLGIESDLTKLNVSRLMSSSCAAAGEVKTKKHR